MGLSKKGAKILRAMVKHYGVERGKKVFYASVKDGKIRGVEGKKKSKK